MNWLLDNKEWIFSGIGVLIISIIWTEITAYRRRKSQASHSEEVKTPISARKSVATPKHLSINDILNDIDNQPPYQRDQVRENYLGVKIRFSGVLKYIWKRKKGLVSITIENPKERYPKLHFEIKIDDYPEFKTMREGTPLVVEGTLTKIDFFDSYIQDVEFIN